jgi:redox-sensitive bicupin YhaK (pirin superfamily)
MRTISGISEAVSTVDGAGVKLKRVFGYRERGKFDPFLMLDHFGSDNPEDYLAGFPWHPHRGIETVTYLLSGKVEHGDSMSNSGTIGPGDAQWMTAGSGILHQEMPRQEGNDATMEGFQLWIDLPASLKMTTPRYRSILASEIPSVKIRGGTVSILAGSFAGKQGATPDLFVPVTYLLVRLEPGAEAKIALPASHNAAAYVFRGDAACAGTTIKSAQLARMPAVTTAPEAPHPDAVFKAGSEGVSFLFIAGRPLVQEIAWGGPIVMNTRQELELAYDELDRGTFIKSKASGI